MVTRLLVGMFTPAIRATPILLGNVHGGAAPHSERTEAAEYSRARREVNDAVPLCGALPVRGQSGQLGMHYTREWRDGTYGSAPRPSAVLRVNTRALSAPWPPPKRVRPRHSTLPRDSTRRTAESR